MNRRIVTVLVTVVALLLLAGLSVAFFVLPAARESSPVIPIDTAPDTAATQSVTGSEDSTGGADATDSADATATVGATETTGNQTDEQDTGLQVQQGVGDREDFEGQDPTEPATGEDKPADRKDPVQTPPVETTPDGTQPDLPADPRDMTFAMYEAMSEEDQEKFVDSFDSVADFVDWWNQAKKDADRQDPIKIEDGKIDLGKLP